MPVHVVLTALTIFSAPFAVALIVTRIFEIIAAREVDR